MKTKASKILAMALAMVLVLSLTSCGLEKFSGTKGLEYYPLPDGTYGVKAGTALYLDHVEVPAKHNGKSVSQILPNAFEGASNLTSIVIPNGVTNIEGSSFSACSSLTSITIPNSVTSIGDLAFSSCSSLTRIVIPDSTTSIGYNVFYDCSNLSYIYYCGTETQWDAISKGSDWDNYLENYTIYYSGEFTITYNYAE